MREPGKAAPGLRRPARRLLAREARVLAHLTDVDGLPILPADAEAPVPVRQPPRVGRGDHEGAADRGAQR